MKARFFLISILFFHSSLSTGATFLDVITFIPNTIKSIFTGKSDNLIGDVKALCSNSLNPKLCQRILKVFTPFSIDSRLMHVIVRVIYAKNFTKGVSDIELAKKNVMEVIELLCQSGVDVSKNEIFNYVGIVMKNLKYYFGDYLKFPLEIWAAFVALMGESDAFNNFQNVQVQPGPPPGAAPPAPPTGAGNGSSTEAAKNLSPPHAAPLPGRSN